MKNMKNRKGFTLVELVVVILIIAILATATFLGGATVIKQARFAKVQTNLSNFATYAQDMMYSNPSLVSYASDTDDSNPDTTEYTATQKAKNLMNDSYLTQDFQLGAMKDSWESEYAFDFANNGTNYACIVISSNGANGEGQSTGAAAKVIAATPAPVSADAVIGNFVVADKDPVVATDIVVGDDLGVVVLMCDGAVSTAYYGF